MLTLVSSNHLWIFIILSTYSILWVNSCQNQSIPTEAHAVYNHQSPTQESTKSTNITPVKTYKLQRSLFEKEVLATGKLEAFRKINLHFKTNGIIKAILINNGQYVKSNQEISSLALEKHILIEEQTLLRKQKAELEFYDQLLRQGFTLTDTSSLSIEIKRIAKLRSGLSDVELEIKKNKTERENHFLYAPFDGKITNLKKQTYYSIQAFENFCTLIDDQEFHIDFFIMEQELDFVRNCQNILITSFTDPSQKHKGVIRSINPTIDDAGMISVKGHIYNTTNYLMDGMGVQIFMIQSVANQLVIPKKAVVERQGRKVVFTATDANTAHWNYIDILWENSEYYAIKAGLKPGDLVIYEGNFDLAHDKPIKIIENF